MGQNKKPETDIEVICSTIIDKQLRSEDLLEGIAAKVAEKVSDKITDKIIELITVKLNEQIQTNCQKFKSEVAADFNDLKERNKRLESKLDDMEQKMKLSCLRVYNVDVDEDYSADGLRNIVCDIFKSKMNLPNIGVDDIEYCYLIKPSNTKRKITRNSRRNPTPIFIKMKSSSLANTVLQKKKILKTHGIGIAEELTRYRYELLMSAKRKLGKKNVWSIGGKVFGVHAGRKIQIRCPEDLNGLDQV